MLEQGVQSAKRISILESHLNPKTIHKETSPDANQQIENSFTSSSKSSITVTDNRNGKSINVPIIHNEAIDANDLRKLNLT